MTATDLRNPGIALDASLFEHARVNTPAAQRRAESLKARRSVKKQRQAAWLVKAITCIDLTTLAGDPPPQGVARLCPEGRRPLRQDLVAGLGPEGAPPRVAGVCVYPSMVPAAVRALEGSGIPVASVATGFPSGLTPLRERLAEIDYAVQEGAGEIDIVTPRAHVLRQNGQALYEEIQAMRARCGAAHMKAILATGDLKTLPNVYQAGMVAMMAGADVIKPSTGKEEVNATLPVGLVMCRAIRDYRSATGHDIGFKPAGGIRTAKDALNWLALMNEELGRAWLEPGMFRIGASAL